ncbi:CpaE family protein [Novosphingobium bradum]|uniref:CpaE family protein n=1 Tax=Novosphingobium bradum TaxID=1737444 RepID=A0ABV7IQ10_9SPHN
MTRPIAFSADPAFFVAPPTPSRRRLVVVAADDRLAALRAAPALAEAAEPVLVALPAASAVPDDALAGADVVVIEVDPADAGSSRRIAEVRASHPGLPVIAALQGADAATMRTLLKQGLADIARLPFDPAELAGQVKAIVNQSAALANGRPLAPMVVMAGSNGGCGVTTVITHLAAALASGGRRVCVVDLDLQGGEVAYYLGREPRVTIEALLDAGDRLDAELLASAVTDSGRGFAVLASPEAITPLDHVDDNRLLALLSLVRREFDFVLVDLPTDWTSWGLSLAASATRVLLLTNPAVAPMRQAKRRLQLFDSVGVASDRVAVVVNRAEHGLFKAIGSDAVASVLEHDILASLADQEDGIVLAQNEGRLLPEIHRHTRFGTDVEALARILTS